MKTADVEAGVAEAVHSACKRTRHVVGCGLRVEDQNISRSRARTSIKIYTIPLPLKACCTNEVNVALRFVERVCKYVNKH